MEGRGRVEGRGLWWGRAVWRGVVCRGGGAVWRGGAVHLGTARCSSLTLATSRAPGSVQASLLDVTAGPRVPSVTSGL